MASEFYTIAQKAQKKQAKLKDRVKEERNSLRYRKFIATIIKLIVSKDDKRLTNNDIKTISLTIYKRYDKLRHIRIRSTLSQGIVKTDINNELQRIYTDAGLSKDALKPLLESIKSWIDDKKDITNALKLVDKIERANNLGLNNTITARTTETIDYSKVGKDGQPAQKVVKTLELTKTDAISSLEGRDNSKADDNVPPVIID